MVTVRARITALATAAAALVLAIAAVTLVSVLRDQLTEQRDTALRARAVELADAAAEGPLPGVVAPVSEDGMVQVVSADGRVLAASPNLAAARGPVADPASRAADLSVATFPAPDDSETEEYRVWRLARATDAGVVTVFVGSSLESVSEATGALRTALLVGIPVMLVLLALGTWYVVGRSLSRVERVRREVDDIGEEELSRRLEPGPPDEVGRLVRTMNAMLARLEDSSRRQRDFVADASHELQSPLTAFRTQLEVAKVHPDRTDWPEVADDLLEDTDRMERLVRDLLVLAAGHDVLPADQAVDLADVAREEVARAPCQAVVVDLVGDDPAPVRGDPEQLGRVVRNLLDNAREHARSRVRVHVATAAADSRVEVADDGPGVPPEDAARIFDRFHRGDPARSRSGRGTGLGLAIARSLARAHGGDVVLEASDAGARFVLRVPRDPGQPAPDPGHTHGRSGGPEGQRTTTSSVGMRPAETWGEPEAWPRRS